MKELIIVALIMTMLSSTLLKTEAQEYNALDNVYDKEHVANRKPIPYPQIREADIMWSKRVWRVIDLRERLNLPLYYPTTQMDDRFNLIGLLLYGIKEGKIQAYSPDKDDEFKVLIDYSVVLKNMGAGIDTTYSENPETGAQEVKILQTELSDQVTEVKQFFVKELWFFDKNRSVLDVRIIGICPIREYIKKDETIGIKYVCWINFNELRPLLASYEIFNQGNDAQRRSFDDLFMSRFFGSYIVRESNTYNNRRIDNYAVGIEAMIESERVKYDIFRMEHDMWEF